MHNILHKAILFIFFIITSNACTQNTESSNNKDSIETTTTIEMPKTPQIPELPDYLLEKPQKLGYVFIPLNEPAEVGDLRLWCTGDFLPERVGSSKGKVTLALKAGLISTFHGKSGEELEHHYHYYDFAWQDMNSYPGRMKNYRWICLEKNITDQGKSGIKVYVDTLNSPEHVQYIEHLKENEETYFWLSTAGVKTINFVEKAILSTVETAIKPEYAIWNSKDYFTVYISTYPIDSYYDSDAQQKVYKPNLWGAKIEGGLFIKGKTPERKDVYLNRDFGAIQQFLNYEFEVMETKLWDDSSSKDGYFIMQDLPNVHALIRVKRVN